MQHIYFNTGYFVCNDPHELIKTYYFVKDNDQNNRENTGDIEQSLI